MFNYNAIGLTLVLCAKCASLQSVLDVTSGGVMSADKAVDLSGSSGDETITNVTARTNPTRKAEDKSGKVLKRTRRYLTFPEGSTFSFAFCMTVKVLTPDDPDIFSEAVALATSYDLPNNTRALGLFPEDEEKEATKLSRRQRSYVYSKAESILEKLGVAGRACVLRAICEGAQQLRPADNLLTEILRVVLSFPENHSSAEEPAEQWVYLGAYKAGLRNYNCPDLYPACEISFINAILMLRPIT